jgi:aspartate/methionine/tyrosine aminotransferase
LDWCFSEFLTKEIGVTTIPFSVFYEDNEFLPENIVRFAFCHKEESLIEAGKRIKNLLNYI